MTSRSSIALLTNSTCFLSKSILTATLQSKLLFSHAEALPLQQALASFPALFAPLCVASPWPTVAACFCWLLSMYFQIVWLGVLISLSVFMFISETHTHSVYVCAACVFAMSEFYLCAVWSIGKHFVADFWTPATPRLANHDGRSPK